MARPIRFPSILILALLEQIFREEARADAAGTGAEAAARRARKRAER